MSRYFNPDIILNRGQKEAVSLHQDFIKMPFEQFKGHFATYNSDNRSGSIWRDDWFALRGPGGAGKTTVVDAIISDFCDELNIVAATLSHQAKNVLASKLTSDVQCVTLARAVGMETKLDAAGNTVFYLPKNNTRNSKFNNPPAILSAEVFIVDEASMLSDTLMDFIDKLRKPGSKVICILDPYQLKPVDQDRNSQTVDIMGIDLTKVERNTGAILDLCMDYRFHMEREEWNYDLYLNHLQSNVVETLPNREIVLDKAVSIIQDSNITINDLKFIVYTNKTALNTNLAIKKKLGHTHFYQEGDWVCLGNSYAPLNYRTANQHENKLILTNGTHMYIKEAKPHYINMGQYQIGVVNSMEVTFLKCEYQYGPHAHQTREVHLYVLSPKQKAKYKENFDKILARAKTFRGTSWLKFYKFKELVASLTHAYSQTSYKVQGQSVKHVIADVHDAVRIHRLADLNRFQSNYVAVSRTVKSLTIC